VTLRRTVGVLVSGAGTNLEALLKACAVDGFPAQVGVVISNRREAAALDIARAWEVPAAAMPLSDFDGDKDERDRAMVEHLRGANVELVVCAGYNRILSDEFLHAFPDAILNVHPSLLPAFAGGMDAVERALASGVKVSGCTVQLLEPGEPDGGPIVLQTAVCVDADDDVASLRQRIHEQEWRLLPRAVALWCTGRLRRDGRMIRILRDIEAGGDAGGSPGGRVKGGGGGGVWGGGGGGGPPPATGPPSMSQLPPAAPPASTSSELSSVSTPAESESR
jgi:phosphoribosylglycinamide formyltransferase-1